MRWLFLAAFLVLNYSASSLAAMPSHGQPENNADPADCGATACPTYHAELANFPYWDRAVEPWGYSGGPLNDGTYLYLGTINGYGYLTTSNHSGVTDTSASYRFAPHGSAHDGWVMRATGLASFRPTADWERIVQVSGAQLAPNCASPGSPDACCLGYDLGNGSCSGGTACGAGCTTYSLPNLPMLPLAYQRDLVPDVTLMLYISGGPGASLAREWYLECNSATTRGGLGGLPNACCSVAGTRLEYDKSVAGFVSWSNSLLGDPYNNVTGVAGTNDALVIGGAGHNCDSYGGGPGYTYLGPLAETSGEPQGQGYAQTWWMSKVSIVNDDFVTDSLIVEPLSGPWDTNPGSVGAECWAKWRKLTPSVTSSAVLADHLNYVIPPITRNGARADCLCATARAGDSGSNGFAYIDGSWRLVGAISISVFHAEILSASKWNWWPVIFGTPFGRSGW